MHLRLYDAETIGCQIMGRTQSGVSKDSKSFWCWSCSNLSSLPLPNDSCVERNSLSPSMRSAIADSSWHACKWFHLLMYQPIDDVMYSSMSKMKKKKKNKSSMMIWSYVPWSWGSPEDPCGCGILKLSCYYQSSRRQIKALSLLVWQPFPSWQHRLFISTVDCRDSPLWCVVYIHVKHHRKM